MLLNNFYLISTTFVQDQEKADGISSTGKPVVNATENNTGEKCAKCGRVGEALLLCTV